MRFKKGEWIIRHELSHKIIYVDEISILLESSDDETRVSIPMGQLTTEYVNGLVYMEGTVSPATKQNYNSPEQRQRIAFRTPYAKAFGEASVSRSQCHELIVRIYNDCKHRIVFPDKRPPSRASCYRWAKKLKDNFGDTGALRNG